MRYALSVLHTQCFTFGLIYIYSARARYNKGIIFIPPPAHFSWVSTPPRNSTSPTCVISASHAPPITNMRGWVSQSLSYAHPPILSLYLSSHINGTASSNGPICPKPSRSGRRCCLRPPIKRCHPIPNNSSLLFLTTKIHLTFTALSGLNPDFLFNYKKKSLSVTLEAPTHT